MVTKLKLGNLRKAVLVVLARALQRLCEEETCEKQAAVTQVKKVLVEDSDCG
jgi:hypothetical protein